MAEFIIAGQTHSVPPLKFREIKAASPYIDRVLDRRKRVSQGERTVEQIVEQESGILQTMTDSVSDILCVLSIGVLLERGEFPYTPAKIHGMAESLEADASMDDINGLNSVFDSVLREAGLVRAAGDPRKTEGAPAVEDPSPTESIESSPSLSQPDAPVETGTE